MPRVLVPPPLRSYTGGEATVTVAGSTLGDLLAGLDARYPGMRFRMVDEQERIRPHIWMFVGGIMATALAQPVRDDDEVRIVAALSGG